MFIVNKVWQLREFRDYFLHYADYLDSTVGHFTQALVLTDLSITTNHHLLPTKHHICRSLQTKKKEEVNHDYIL